MATNFSLLLQQLLEKLNAANQGLDDQTVNIRTGTSRGIFDANQERVGAIRNQLEGAADRGMLNSGAALAQNAEVRSNYDKLVERLNQDQANALASISRQRLNAQSSYNQGEAGVKQQMFDEEQARKLEEQQRQNEIDLRNAAANPTDAGITPGITYGSGDEYARAAQAYMDALARNASQPAPAPAPAPRPRNPAPRIPSTPRPPQPLRPAIGRY